MEDVCRMVFSIFSELGLAFATIFQLYHGGQFYWWRKLTYLEKTTDLPQVTDKLYHIKMYQIHLPEYSGFELRTTSGDRN